ncbi:tyrosine-type recombinase/integrase [Stenotrophomonas forensis]|uniref:Tyrosine-type recombinase/integrase n=1 Tax=Stenotrophomonas forensis TaxID=2871169 RepID=A0ABY7Y5U3_9GAMM|nr:tyrosine-type recombinase/integrase [Stenotrophomonas sp. DFS-20110405]WDM65343.1 tyrosine-type recombinase/integrase [Stenotrophomonas sp. DFS-20110405]
MVTVRLYWRGTRAYIDWTESNGRFRKSIGQCDASEAERIRSAKEAELTHGVRILAHLPKVCDYLEWYLDWYEAEHPTTISKARSEVKRFIERFGLRPIDSIRAIEVEEYKRSRLLDDKAAKETVGKEIRRLKTAFNRGVEWKELGVNPLASVKAPRGVRSVAVKFYDRAAMRRLYRANPSRAPLWLFMAHTGIRRGELTGLKKDSVVGSRLWVESTPDENGLGRTKSGKWREVPLNRYAKWALRHLPDPLVTAHMDTVSDWFRKDAKLAGIGGHLHRLRHTFCAHMVVAGVPLRRVQLLAGHADYTTTEKFYAHLSHDGDIDAVRSLRY